MSAHVSAMERRWLLAATLGVLLAASLPYLVGWGAQTPDRVFTGLQVNPLDGVTYLAKMNIGLRGEWLFQLAYTSEQSTGTFLLTYFIALGHVARVLQVPPLLVFHFMRVMGGGVLLWVVYHFIARVTDTVTWRRRMWWLVATSSGLGWLASLVGYGNSADLTIAESNTFFSLMANTHFALATALMLGLFMGVLDTTRAASLRPIGLGLLSILLGIIQPFMAFVVYGALGVTLLIVWRRDRVLPRAPLITAFIAGLMTAPLLLYLFLATQADALLRVWAAQNQTPSPAILDYVLGYGLLLIAAVPGARAAWRRRSTWDILLLVWIGVTLSLLYAPIPLQRRMSLGLHIPIAVLAAWGLNVLVRRNGPRRALMAAMALTSAFLIVVLSAGAATRDARVFITADEARAFDWLQANSPREAVVLAAPETGAFIPAFADRRVVYGHPFETVEAKRKEQAVLDFWAGTSDAALREADYVFIGPRERALGDVSARSAEWQLVFQSNDVAVFAVAAADQ